ncbi:hypothetical protein ALISP_2110 [Alicycliphilus sp. B1]|nr:hypothetical protein ALISP_2110 [Alicycliphilus sp. B1]
MAQRMLRLVREGVVEAVDGSLARVQAQSICVHGDSAGAVEMARACAWRSRATASSCARSPEIFTGADTMQHNALEQARAAAVAAARQARARLPRGQRAAHGRRRAPA